MTMMSTITTTTATDIAAAVPMITPTGEEDVDVGLA